MPSIDPELTRKLQTRRSVVDLQGTQWVVSEERAQELRAAAAARARASSQAGAEGKGGGGSGAAVSATPAPTERGARRGNAGAIDSELVQKLQERRGVVDSRGSAWQRLPEAPRSSAAAQRWGRAAPEAAGPGGGGAADDPSSEALERHGIRPVRKLWDGAWRPDPDSGAPAPPAEARRGSTGSMDSELVRKLQTRRGVVDSEGSAWQRLPRAAPPPAGAGAAQRAGGSGRAAEAEVQKPTAHRDAVDSEGSACQEQPRAPGGSGSGGEAEGRTEARAEPPAAGPPPEPGRGGAEAAEEAPAEAPAEPPAAGPPREPGGGAAEVAEGAAPDSAEVPSAAAASSVPVPRVIGELRPWEELWGGAETWVCDVWLPRFLESGSRGEHEQEKGADETPGGGAPGAGPLAAPQAAVLCVAPGGEISFCVPGQPPPGAEDVDHGRLVASFGAASLRGLSRSSAQPEVLGFHLASAAGLLGGGGADGSAPGGPRAAPSLYARLESLEGAASAVEAIAGAAAARVPIAEEAPPRLGAAGGAAPPLGEAAARPLEEGAPLAHGGSDGHGGNWVTLGKAPPGGWLAAVNWVSAGEEPPGGWLASANWVTACTEPPGGWAAGAAGAASWADAPRSGPLQVAGGGGPAEGRFAGAIALRARPPAACGPGSAGLAAETQAFLRELDRLAGYA